MIREGGVSNRFHRWAQIQGRAAFFREGRGRRQSFAERAVTLNSFRLSPSLLPSIGKHLTCRALFIKSDLVGTGLEGAEALIQVGFIMKFSVPIFKLKRQARLLSRQIGVPLHEALDQIAADEGFVNWSRLASRYSSSVSAPRVARELTDGDMVLLGSRPGHGKTAFGIEIAIAAIRQGKRAWFFSLEYNVSGVTELIRTLGYDPSELQQTLSIDTTDDLCDEHIIKQVANPDRSTVIVVDYLQILDQKRTHSELALQVKRLHDYITSSRTSIIFLSQIDRGFDLSGKSLPDLSDIRLPNSLDKHLFTKACFLHDGDGVLLSL